MFVHFVYLFIRLLECLGWVLFVGHYSRDYLKQQTELVERLHAPSEHNEVKQYSIKFLKDDFIRQNRSIMMCLFQSLMV